MSSYYEQDKSPLKAGDVIEWEPPKVDFEFIAGVCVQATAVDIDQLWRMEAIKQLQRDRE